jgi:hypothetical protein
VSEVRARKILVVLVESELEWSPILVMWSTDPRIEIEADKRDVR